MFIKSTTMTLIVTVLFFVAAWSSASFNSDVESDVQTNWLNERLELHRHLARGQAPDDRGDANTRSKQINEILNGSMFNEGGSY